MKTHNFVEELLARMTLEQKIGQMTQTERLVITPAEVKKYHVGSVLSGGGSVPGDNLPSDWVQMNDEYWAASMEADEGYLPIPLLYGVDAIHGHNNVLGATVFPHNIGLGAARDPELLSRIARITALEILATGVDWTFAPTLAVAQSINWGRTYESYSSDPALVKSYAAPFVGGLQADLGEDAVIACVKHWVGDGGTTNGIDQGETTLDLDTLRRVHVQPYLPALEAGVQTVMVSFNSWNGDKCHGHKYLLTDLLKGELGFEGFIISDWDGIDYLDPDYREAIALSVDAGIDLFMVSEKWQDFILNLIQLVESGRVPRSRIDDAVRRILNVKFEFGLFDKPRPLERKWSDHESFGSAAHREVAREAVRKSQVLLKNQGDLLPLSPEARVLVAGKFADDTGALAGGFTIAWQGRTGPDAVPGATSVWQAVRKVAPQAELSEGGLGLEADPAKHDVAVVVIGEYPYAEGLGDIREDDNVLIEAGSRIRGEIKTLAPYGRSLHLSALHPEDLQVINAIREKGVAVVAILVSGRPLYIEPELNASDALVAAWLPGSEGDGIADTLFGSHAYQGKLPMAWPSTKGTLFDYGFGL